VKLKYLDESRFETKGHNKFIFILFIIKCTLPCSDCRPRSGFSPSGQEAVAPAGDNFRESFTLTAIVSLSSDQPLWVSQPRDATSDAFGFFGVITWLLEEGALQAGDYPILDNARVHHATQTTPMIEDLLGLHGVQMRFLPALVRNYIHANLLLLRLNDD